MTRAPGRPRPGRPQNPRPAAPGRGGGPGRVSSRPGGQLASRRARSRGDAGAATLYVVIAGFPLLLVMAGLLIDGGRALTAREEATVLVDQAARAAADQISARSLRTGDPAGAQIDPSAARVAGRRVLAAGGATGSVTVTAAHQVAVTAHITRPTTILSVIHLEEMSVTGTATATVLYGTTTGTR
jgi:Flp pilus assembly protein TadG